MCIIHVYVCIYSICSIAPVFAALRAEHRVRAEYVAVLGQVLQKDLLRVGLYTV